MTKVKDFIALLKDAVLLCFFLLLIFFPSFFNGILQKAGFTEGSIMGFNWKQKALESKEVADSSQKLATLANMQLEQIQKRMDSQATRLAVVGQTSSDTSVLHIAKAIDVSQKQLIQSSFALKKNIAFQNEKLKMIFSDKAMSNMKE